MDTHKEPRFYLHEKVIFNGQKGTVIDIDRAGYGSDDLLVYTVRMDTTELISAYGNQLTLFVKDRVEPSGELTFKEYATAAETTIVYPHTNRNLLYPALKLAGEAGEVAEKIGKLMRDKGLGYPARLADMDASLEEIIEIEDDLVKELGDVLWYVFALASEIGVNFEHVARTNIQKLHARKAKGTLQGSGDNR